MTAHNAETVCVLCGEPIIVQYEEPARYWFGLRVWEARHVGTSALQCDAQSDGDVR